MDQNYVDGEWIIQRCLGWKKGTTELIYELTNTREVCS